MLWKKANSRRSLYLFPGHYIKNKNRFILTGIQVFWSRNKLRTGALPRNKQKGQRSTSAFSKEYVILPVHFCFPENKSFSQPTLRYPEHFRITGKSILQNTFFTEQLPVAPCCVINNLYQVQPIQCLHLRFVPNEFGHSMVSNIRVNYFKLNFREKAINPLIYLESIIMVLHITIKLMNS